jgi:hypothetical protein
LKALYITSHSSIVVEREVARNYEKITFTIQLNIISSWFFYYYEKIASSMFFYIIYGWPEALLNRRRAEHFVFSSFVMPVTILFSLSPKNC